MSLSLPMNNRRAFLKALEPAPLGCSLLKFQDLVAAFGRALSLTPQRGAGSERPALPVCALAEPAEFRHPARQTALQRPGKKRAGKKRTHILSYYKEFLSKTCLLSGLYSLSHIQRHLIKHPRENDRAFGPSVQDR